MSITKYTSYDEVRFPLGVTRKELKDEELALPIFETQLLLALDDVSPEIATLYDTIQAIDPLVTPLTTAQTRFLSACSLYSTYVVADTAGASMPMYSLARITDGKAEQERFDKSLEVLANIKAKLAYLRSKLAAAFTDAGGTGAIEATATFTHARASALTFDPVTNA